MKIIDTQPCNRQIILEKNDVLDSRTMVNALMSGKNGIYGERALAEAIVCMIFDSLGAYYKKQAQIMARGIPTYRTQSKTAKPKASTEGSV